MSNLKPYELLIRFPLDPLGAMAWHAVLAAPGGTDAMGRPRPWDVTDALTPEQSEAMGFPFDSLVGALNTDALKERDALLVANQGLLAEQRRLESQLAALTSEIAALRTGPAVIASDDLPG